MRQPDYVMIDALTRDPQNRCQVKLALKLGEECGEAIREVKKIEAGKDRSEQLLDELGDVLSAVLKLAALHKFRFDDILEKAYNKRVPA